MIHGVYNLILSLLLLLASPLVLPAVLFGRGWRKGALERFGFYPRGVRRAFEKSRPLWIHAVSVGEVRAAFSLAAELKRRSPGLKIILSTFTHAGYNMASRMGGAADGIIFFPLDHPWAVRRALSVFAPSAVIFLETEIWPNFLYHAHRRGIPTLLLSGRISPRAFRRYRRWRWFFSGVLKRFTAAGMQNEIYAQRIINLGVNSSKVTVTGNLKHAGDEGLGTVVPSKGETVLGMNGTRRVLVAGSTHRGEEELLLDVFSDLKAVIPDLLMILAPRHPKRFEEVEKLLQRKHVNYLRKSSMNGHGAKDADVIFLDTLGDLPMVYSVASVVFVGGSLVDVGGHNLIEPARWSKPLLFGPYMTNFADLASEMKQSGGGVEVKGREDLMREVTSLLTEPGRALEVGQNARQVVDGDRGVVERSLELVSRYF